jgi:hypothetical protein
VFVFLQLVTLSKEKFIFREFPKVSEDFDWIVQIFLHSVLYYKLKIHKLKTWSQKFAFTTSK